jgi:hypothetical protein
MSESSTARRMAMMVAGLLCAALGGAAAGYWYGSGPSREFVERGDPGPGERSGGRSSDSSRDGARWAAQPPPAAARNDRAAITDAAAPSEAGAGVAPAPQAAGRLEQVDAAARMPGRYERLRGLEASLEQLAAVDPQGALARARALEPSVARQLLPRVIGAWAVHDVQAATEQAFLLEPATLRMTAANEILRRRQDLSPADRRSIARQLAEPESTEWLLFEASANPGPSSARAALDEALAMAGQARRHERLGDIASLLAVDAPEAALALADGITDVRDRAAFKATVAGLWADVEPEAAARWFEQDGSGARWSVVSAVAAPYARSDPRAALDWARRIDPQGNGGAWSAVIATIAETDPVTAVEQALAADLGRGPRSAKTIAMAFLARKDPQLATIYLERLPTGAERTQATAQIALEMARQGDPAQAIDWLAARKDPAAERQGRSRIAYTWASNDAAAALDFAARLPAQSRREWQGAVVNAIANVDPDGLLDLIHTRRGDADYPALLATTARAVAGRQPDIAISLASELSDPVRRDEVLSGAIPQLAQQAPREAVDLLERIDDPVRRAAASRSVVQVWAQRDAEGAHAWVRAMPAGPERDEGLAAVVPHLRSPREMESAVRRIQSENVRSQAVFNAAMLLAQRGEADEARALVFRNPLEPGLMATLESRLRDQGDAAR